MRWQVNITYIQLVAKPYDTITIDEPPFTIEAKTESLARKIAETYVKPRPENVLDQEYKITLKMREP